MACSTPSRTGVVAALSRYTARLVMRTAIYRLEGLDAKLQHVVHGEGLVREERLAVGPPDQRPVVGGLHADQLVEVLPRREDLAGRLGAVELRGVAADRLHLRFEAVRDIHDERRLHRVFPVGQRIKNLERPMGLTRPPQFGETGEVAGIAS